ncbi:MAG: PD40 domain-containing protein [Bacteroidaceae bacterium]|nr:PD40 domain-containing protein [Bacteroidaceae bacterium]
MPMNKTIHTILFILACVTLISCRGASLEHILQDKAELALDSSDVVIPYNIAPLNFCLNANQRKNAIVEVHGSEWNLRVRARKGRVMFPMKKWKLLLEAEKGHHLSFFVDGEPVTHNSFLQWVDTKGEVFVSEDPIDSYITYRLIDPGFEVWHRVEIRERNVTCFDERIISDWKHTDNSCMNCHTHGGSRGDLSFFHLRGKDGGTILNRDGALRKLTLKTDSMPVAATYGDLHPSGRFAVFSYNVVLPSLRALGSNRMEIYDSESDLVIADFDTQRLIFSPLVSGTNEMETFPTFSPDGKYVYFCRAPFRELPDSVENVHYDIVRIAFNPDTQMWGDSIEVVWKGEDEGGSASFPKFSPDGRFLLYCRSNFGTFPIWHRETSLQLMDMQSGEVNPLPNLASNASSSYHSWSHTGRWIAFASKRGDGIYGRVWFAHIDERGQVSRPFRLPQRDPEHDLLFLKSYNVPSIAESPVPFDAADIGKLRKNVSSEQFEQQ